MTSPCQIYTFPQTSHRWPYPSNLDGPEEFDPRAYDREESGKLPLVVRVLGMIAASFMAWAFIGFTITCTVIGFLDVLRGGM